jgi:hypothetical protein
MGVEVPLEVVAVPPPQALRAKPRLIRNTTRDGLEENFMRTILNELGMSSVPIEQRQMLGL